MIYVISKTDKAQAAEKKLKETLEKIKPGFDADLVVAIGGDGTMLHAIMTHQDKNIPFLGISAGKLGFLQIVELDQIDALAEALVQNKYSTIDVPLIAAVQNDKSLGYAFNDISVERGGPRAAKFNVQIGKSGGSFIGDGIIFATPLGSTAYTLAAGGPIIDSKAQNVMVVTPNNPHVSVLYSTLQRPHVISGSRKVAIQIDEGENHSHPVKLVIDGETILDNISGEVDIVYSDRTVKLIEFVPDGFHDRIENKRLGRN